MPRIDWHPSGAPSESKLAANTARGRPAQAPRAGSRVDEAAPAAARKTSQIREKPTCEQRAVMAATLSQTVCPRRGGAQPAAMGPCTALENEDRPSARYRDFARLTMSTAQAYPCPRS